MRFIYAHDGTAVNVAHIITIFIAATRQPEGFVVRCRTSLADGQYAIEHAVLNLSPILESREGAETWFRTVLDKLSPL